ncbi:hypothetical protein Pcinc_022238 [Petrolisthes cinctipes]|uniref:G-protein coupled receptors family 1 profile domain-containing protein n=1 Tax=Petrolisthes cinctipes TaxID=88211 RepID=A0AAE1FFV0_PETCI|nr:hypothetical protein Pcinc_022238 [Petrolisthes cinctipes]
MLQWISTRTPQDSLTAALPLADLLVCLLAAPLRYAQTPPVMRSEEQHPWNITLGRTEPASNTTYVHGHGCYGEGCEAGRLIVVGLCVWSLHVVVVVALHRLALLLRLSPTLPPYQATPVFVAVVALVVSSALVGGLHAVSCFMEALPMLGECRPLLLHDTPPMSVIAFLSYLAILCGFTLICYLVIMAALLHQGCARPTYTSSAVPLPRAQEGDGVIGLNGQERALHACATVLMVLVTLIVCWMLPVTLALYVLLIQPSLTPTLPYSDALILLSALVHPFVYHNGWAALLACFDRLCYSLVSTAKILKISHKSKVQTLPIERAQKQEQASAAVEVTPTTTSSPSNPRASNISMSYG